MRHDPSAGPPRAAIADLTRGLQGEVLLPGSSGFDEARRVWNGMISRTPAVIARCASAQDVARALAFAQEHGLPVAVRGGGHSVVGNGVCDDGLVVDLSPMTEISVDPRARIIHAGGGITWGRFDAATQAHGLATTGGVISTTGIAGLTLGGGLGWLMRRFGLACDNLLAAQVVTAHGRIVTAGADEQPDLFWGLRGGGGNFGVVTRFTYRLHPVGPVLAGMLLYPFAAAPDVLRRYREAMEDAPDELTIYAVLRTTPDSERAVTLLAFWSGDLDEGERLLAPLRAFGTPLADTIAPMAYADWQSSLDAGNPPGLRNYWKSSFLKRLDDGAIATLVEGFTAAPSPRSTVLIEGLGGAFARVPADATAFSRRDAPYDLHIASVWDDPAEDQRQIGWARELFAAMDPYVSGMAYVNYLGAEEGERVRAAYGEATYARLVALKDRYDPGNLFRLNQNIPPPGWRSRPRRCAVRTAAYTIGGADLSIWMPVPAGNDAQVATGLPPFTPATATVTLVTVSTPVADTPTVSVTVAVAPTGYTPRALEMVPERVSVAVPGTATKPGSPLTSPVVPRQWSRPPAAEVQVIATGWRTTKVFAPNWKVM